MPKKKSKEKSSRVPWLITGMYVHIEEERKEKKSSDWVACANSKRGTLSDY